MFAAVDLDEGRPGELTVAGLRPPEYPAGGHLARLTTGSPPSAHQVQVELVNLLAAGGLFGELRGFPACHLRGVESYQPRLSGQAQAGLQGQLAGNSGQSGRSDWSDWSGVSGVTADSEEPLTLALLPHLPPSEAAHQEVLTSPLTPRAAPPSGPARAQPGQQEVLGHRQVNHQQQQQLPDNTKTYKHYYKNYLGLQSSLSPSSVLIHHI